MQKLLLLFTCISLFTAAVAAQSYKEAGSQAIINYSPKEYDANKQIWAITQNEKGIMYFGTSEGLLEFDGATWRFYMTTKEAGHIGGQMVKKMYAGANGDLGYFLSDSSGQLTFHSLLNFIPQDKRDFADVWNTYINTARYILTLTLISSSGIFIKGNLK